MTYFDLNDFDEVIMAPMLWGVIRMVNSILIDFQTLEIESDHAMNTTALFINSYTTRQY